MRRSPFFILLIAGLVFVVCGVGYGLTSHEIMYQTVGKGTIAHYLSADGSGYLQMTHSSTLYIVHETTFSPPINGIHTFADGDTIAFAYDPGNTTLIDVSSKLGTHLYGNAYDVVEITSYNKSNQVYATSAYTKDIQGYYKNNWLFGGILIIFGLLLTGLSFFVGRRNKPALEPKQASLSSFQDNTSITQSQSPQPDVSQQSTAPYPQTHLPMPSFPAQFTMPQTPSQPVPFANQASSSKPISFSGLSSLPQTPSQPVPFANQSSISNPPSFSGLLSSYKQQTFGNQPTVTGQSAHSQLSSTSQQQFMNVPQLSFDQPLPQQQAFPQQPDPGETPALQEQQSQSFAHYAHYPQNDDETTQIANPPSQPPQ